MRWIIQILLCGLWLVTCGDAATGRDWTLRMHEAGNLIEGDAIHWTEESFFILGRDGKLWQFGIEKAPQAKQVKQPFVPFTQSQMRASLHREFGSTYDVSGTGHYLVVHPAGQRDVWAERFERLYRDMTHFFTARGFPVKSPQFPLVAIVFPSKEEFLENAQADGMTDSDVLGYYSDRTNRIMLYDQTGGQANFDWQSTAETLVHEAAHQTAFNTGVHGRFHADASGWVCEGIGTLFEARGIYDGLTYRDLKDRINDNRLASFRQYFPNGIPSGTLKSLVASDQMFEVAPLPAYSLSWGFTFMAAERQTSEWVRYLRLTADKPGFQREVSPTERLRDFESVFGADWTMLETRLNRFLAELP